MCAPPPNGTQAYLCRPATLVGREAQRIEAFWRVQVRRIGVDGCRTDADGRACRDIVATEFGNRAMRGAACWAPAA